MRDFGFSKGFGIENSDWKQYGHETDKRIVGHQWGQGAEPGGRAAMETLLQKDPNINVVYSINEPTAAGAYAALKAAGKDKGVLIVSVDGGCPGVKNVAAGIIGATGEYPLLMASKGVEAAVEYAKTGKKPQPTPAARFLQHRRLARHRQAGRGEFRRSPRRKASRSAGAERAGEPLSQEDAGGARVRRQRQTRRSVSARG